MEEKLPSEKTPQKKERPTPMQIYNGLSDERRKKFRERYDLTEYEGGSIKENELNNIIQMRKENFDSFRGKDKQTTWLQNNLNFLPFLWESEKNWNLISLVSSETKDGRSLTFNEWVIAYLDYAELPETTITLNLYPYEETVNLSHANLEGTQFNYLLDCNFIGANLTRCYFTTYENSRCNFSNANLTNAIFDGGILTGSNFTDATLNGAGLYNVNLTGAKNITFAQLKQTKHLWKVTLPPNLLTEKETIQLESKWIDSYAADAAHEKKRGQAWFDLDVEIPEKKLKESTAIFQLIVIALCLPPSQWENHNNYNDNNYDKKVEPLYMQIKNTLKANDLNTPPIQQ